MSAWIKGRINPIIFFFLLPMILWGNPQGGKVVAGRGEITESGKTVQVKTSHRAIIDWDNFSVGKGETTRFVQPHANSAVLNRVQGGDVSHINGLLQANGRVYLVNPRGVVIGKEGIIQTAGFLASTLNCKDSDFLLGEDLLFRGNSGASILNLGTVKAIGGDVVLLARTVVDQGKLEGEGVRIGVGEEILLKQVGLERIYISAKNTDDVEEVGIDSQGKIAASIAELKADGNLFRLAINQEGVIEAQGILEENGRVFLVADGGTTHCSGTITTPGGSVHALGDQVFVKEGAHIDVSADCGGGEALFGGDYQGKNPEIQNAHLTVVEKGSSVFADALVSGDGGKVIFWSDHTVDMRGEISARGGPEGGDGGFVEVSGLYGLTIKGGVTTEAPKGKAGMLLLDPTDITISDVGLNPGYPYAPCYTDPLGPVNDAYILISDLENCLATTNVTISTQSDSNQNGDITLFPYNAGVFIDWNSSYSLFLNADRDIHSAIQMFNSTNGNQGVLSYVAVRDITIKNAPNQSFFIGMFTETFTPGLGSVVIDAGRDVLMFQDNTGLGPAIFRGQDIQISAGRNVSIVNQGYGWGIETGNSFTLTSGGDCILGGLAPLAIVPTGVQIQSFGTASLTVGGDFICRGGSIDYSRVSISADDSVSFPSVGGNFTFEGGTGFETYVSVGGPINIGEIGGNLILIGGPGAQASVQLGSGEDVQIGTVGQNLVVSGGLGEQSYAQLLGGDLLSIGRVGGEVVVRGGAGDPSPGEIISLTPGGTIEFGKIGGGVRVTGGSGGVAVIGPQASGLLSFDTIGRDVVVTGGTAGDAVQGYALIGRILPLEGFDTFLNDIRFGTVGGDLRVVGGTGTGGCFAQIGLIGGIGGDLSFSSIGGGVLVQGGSGIAPEESDDAHAQIGHSGRDSFAKGGNISIGGIGEDLRVIGGTNDQRNYAQIGHVKGNRTYGDFTAAGDINISRGVGILEIRSVDSTAMIGHGNQYTNGGDHFSGSISVSMKGSATITAAESEGDIFLAGIGFLTRQDTFLFNVRSPFVALSSRDLHLNGVDGASAFVGYYTLEGAVSDVQISRVSVTTQNDVVLNGAGGGDAAIGAYCLTGGAFAASVQVVAGGDVILSPSDTGDVRILTNNPMISGPYDVFIEADNIYVGNQTAGLAFIEGSRNLQMIADQDIYLHPNASLFTLRGDLTVVVDGAYPNPQDRGDGRFLIDPGATLNSAGALRIFTSQRNLNSINALLNGVSFVPGPCLINSVTEQWGSYFFEVFGGFPFTIFYKEAIPNYINFYAQYVSEMFHSLEVYDRLLFSSRCFTLQYERECADLTHYPKGMITSFDLFCEEDFNALVRKYRNYNTQFTCF